VVQQQALLTERLLVLRRVHAYQRWAHEIFSPL